MPPSGFEHEAYKERSDHLGGPPNALLVHQATINNTTPQAATLSPNLPHRTTGHPFRGLAARFRGCSKHPSSSWALRSQYVLTGMGGTAGLLQSILSGFKVLRKNLGPVRSAHGRGALKSVEHLPATATEMHRATCQHNIVSYSKAYSAHPLRAAASSSIIQQVGL